MINTLLVIFFSLSSNAGTALIANVCVQPEVRVEIASAHDEAVSEQDAQALYSLMESNRQRIFDGIGEKSAQENLADLEALLNGEEVVLVSSAK